MTPRNTQQRTAVVRALRQTGGFRTAQQLHEEVRAGGESVGLATIYRNLRSMAAAGELDVLHPPGGEAIYRLCELQDHHHHLVCRACGKTVEIDSPDIEKWARTMAKRHRFRAVVHTAELYGFCSGCSMESAERKSPSRG